MKPGDLVRVVYRAWLWRDERYSECIRMLAPRELGFVIHQRLPHYSESSNRMLLCLFGLKLGWVHTACLDDELP